MKTWYISSILGLFILLSQFSNVNAQSWKDLMDSTKFYEDKQVFQTALQWAKAALPQAEKQFGKNDSNYISNIGYISKFYYYLDNLDSAVYYGEIRLSLARIFFKGDNLELASSLNNMAVFYKKQGNIERVESLYKESLDMRRRLFKGDNAELAKCINNLAIFYESQGDYKKAEPLFKEALEMCRRIFKEDHTDLARVITSMAYFYAEGGDYKQAEPLLKEALEIRRRIFKTDNPDLAKSLNNLGTFYDARGDYALAEPLLRDALDMRRRLFKGDNYDLAISMNNMATFYNDRGDYKQAEPLLKEALEMRRRLFKYDHSDLVYSINNMAYYYFDRGNYKMAEPLFKEALEMVRRMHKNDHPDLASSINNMANFYDVTGDYKQAEPLFIEALEIYRRIYKDNHPGLATGINNMACFYDDRGDYKHAEALYKEALEMRRRIFKSDHPDLALSIDNMATFCDEREDYKQAEKLYNEALNIYKNMIDNYFPSLSENEKKLFWNTVSNRFEAFNSFGVKRYSENPLISCNMYDMQLYTKALLFNSTNKIKKRILNSNDLDLIDKYKEFIDKKELLVKIYTMTEEERKKKGFNTDSIEKITNDLEKELSMKSELYTESYEKKKVTWKSIQTLLKPDEAAVEVIRFRYREKNRFTDTIYYAFLIVTDQMEDHPDIVVLENGKELENEYYTDYRIKIKSSIEDKQSYSRYWEKLHDKLKVYKKIYFSADGIYNKLNPATLIMPNGKYLLEEQDIQQVNSTKDLYIGYQKSKDESNIYNSAVLIGNPNFSLSETKVREAVKKIRGHSNENKNFEKMATTRGINLGRLPGTEKEIKDIEKYLKSRKWDVECYLWDMALKTAIKSVSNPRILHIATHGMFLEDVNLEDKETFGFETKEIVENPLLRSGLFFTGAKNYIKSDSTKSYGDENGLLTAYEAMNLDLDKTELVVLSACETGLGEVNNGEGVFGLRRAFQQAGAKSVIMSLWEVNDEATQKLMSSFYSKWVAGIPKREAFSEAQQEVRKQFPEPYYWGAFVMVGE